MIWCCPSNDPTEQAYLTYAGDKHLVNNSFFKIVLTRPSKKHQLQLKQKQAVGIHTHLNFALNLVQMDRSTTPTGPVVGGPLSNATPDRVNRNSPLHSPRSASKDASPLVFEKATSPFNSLSMSAHSKLLERKTADAALKRAMVGREEAEAEMGKLREENAKLRKSIEEGKDRERKVGERLETVMVC